MFHCKSIEIPKSLLQMGWRHSGKCCDCYVNNLQNQTALCGWLMDMGSCALAKGPAFNSDPCWSSESVSLPGETRVFNQLLTIHIGHLCLQEYMYKNYFKNWEACIYPMEKSEAELALFILNPKYLAANKLQLAQCASLSKGNSPDMYVCADREHTAIPRKVAPSCFQGRRQGRREAFQDSSALNLPWAGWGC